MRVFFPTLVDLAILEISPLFLGFVDDDVVPPFFFLLLLPHLVHFMFPIALIWQVLPQFEFVTMMLHFVTTLCYYFCYCYDIECFYNTSYLFIAYP